MQKKQSRSVKQKINALGPVLPGTIRKLLMKCGKDNCRCQSGKNEDKHGPYYFWDRKVNGKQTSSSITEDQVKKFEEWIKNRYALDELCKMLLTKGQILAKKELKK